MAAEAADAGALLQPDIMREPIVWLASDASDKVSGRRFIAAKWNAALSAEQAAQASSPPVAWSGYGIRVFGRGAFTASPIHVTKV